MTRKPDGERALTSTEKVRNLRARRAKEGLTELRGAFVPMDLHKDAKRLIAEWLTSLKTKGALPPRPEGRGFSRSW